MGAPKNLVISTELAQQILTFLVQQPYASVVGLVNGLQSLVAVEGSD
jgi:type IV secretory pathway TrbD component